MYTKEEFKQRFRAMDTEELILNASRPLTDEAMAATSEILAERGLTGEVVREKTKEVLRTHLQGTGVTRDCDYCGEVIRQKLVVVDGQKFCSDACRHQSELSVIALDFEPQVIAEHARHIRNDRCPKCMRLGDVVEVRRVERLVSMIVVFMYQSYDRCSCRRCYQRELRSALIVSALWGWWSPIGLFRNIGVVLSNFEALMSRDPAEPSEALLKYASLDLARASLMKTQTQHSERPEPFFRK